MAILRFNDVGLIALSACVPPRIVSNKDLGYMMEEDNISRLINSTGIIERRYADADVTASDLCYKAAEKLLTDNNIDRTSIDVLIFCTMAHDQIAPPTSTILQHRLNLPTTTACFDLVYACSGFVHSIATAFAFCSSIGAKRALVLVGETMSKMVNPRDKINYPLYGDAGTATLVEKGDFGESFFELTADGSGSEFVKIPSRGFRNPLTAESLIDKEREDNNFRRDIDITMDGMETFNHAIFIIPKQIKFLMRELDITNDDIDYLVSHQANKLMVDYICKKSKMDMNKVPFCLQKFGNTSCASIPLTIASELFDKLEGRKRLFFSAIGAGWSCGTAYLSTKNLKVSPVFDY